MASADAAEPHYHGHRQRLRQRFLSAGAAALADYELLELLLFPANPRGDVKPLAKTLIGKFGSFAAVVNAEPAALMAVPGIGETAAVALKSVQAAVHLVLREGLAERPVLANWQAVLDYCQAVMAHGQIEQFRLLFLDRKNAVIADEQQARGTVDHAPVYPREVARRALELGASALIMVHNHPSGDPTPSRADIEMTRQVRDALTAVGVTLHDHLVIGRAGHSSFRALGLL